ncbi:MAG: nitroreductase family deazaflavin-dependent oxidoreductase [Pseudomonadales bacterium]|nr:nitroreductase family deazaflavin-dependent oxidoreductase [Pseudomonadales bacterium]MCP5320648.1 nitroreductase family deazaflavin-dependent oxidoreductase [Pseudomonadales bacterium]MCP5336607.1 nitroreductase family deazaflavin-dependent oxidoreductase [Pseudomonadales bacterium]
MARAQTTRPVRMVRAAAAVSMRLRVALYRVSDGRLMGRHRHGIPACLVTLRDRERAIRHTVAPMHLVAGRNVILIAPHSSFAPRLAPAWCSDVDTDPLVGVSIAGITRRMCARRVEGSEKRRLWRSVTSAFPALARRHPRAGRTITVVLCTPAD